VTAFRRRFNAFLIFARARFSRESYLGLHLTLGALIIILAAWSFGVIAEDVVRGEPLILLDAQLANHLYLHRRAAPGLTRVMLVITHLHSNIGVGIATALIASYLLWRRRFYRLFALLLSVPGGILLNELAKLAFQRPRPVFEHPILTFKTYSFPSGHAMTATVFYGVLAAFAFWAWRNWPQRVAALCGAGLMILLVAFTRLYLGAHYLSDVLAAMALGLAWLGLCLTTVDTMRRGCIRQPPRKS
jgi:undecaprenyl-diphosphatase